MDSLISAIEGIVVTETEPEVQPEVDRPEAEPEPAIIEDADAGEEFRLTEEIIGLWSQHLELSGTRKATAKELRLIRNRLAERLYQVKTLLARPGRNGQWRSWLKQRGIVRSTADRLCQRYSESLGTTGEIAAPAAINGAEDTVEQLVQTLLPRLRPKLPNTQSVFKFIAAVGEAFGLKSETTDDCIMVSQPKPEKSETSPSATGAAEAVSPDAIVPETGNSSDEIAVEADVAETNQTAAVTS